ncbi:hypothetical protein KY284_033231 [Solanum tuberosum]|nr:hypothetical protein KY284_033231 [Solanum tuberosum]
MAPSTNTMSTSSLHQLIAACSIKLKPANYLIKRTQTSQLIHITENEPSKSSCSTGHAVGKVVAVKNYAKDSGTINDWKEKDVLLKSYISSTLTEENMYLIVGCSTAKEMWECLEKAYIQATKMKKRYYNKTKTWYCLLKKAGEEETTTLTPEKQVSSLLDREQVL